MPQDGAKAEVSEAKSKTLGLQEVTRQDIGQILEGWAGGGEEKRLIFNKPNESGGKSEIWVDKYSNFVEYTHDKKPEGYNPDVRVMGLKTITFDQSAGTIKFEGEDGTYEYNAKEKRHTYTTGSDRISLSFK